LDWIALLAMTEYAYFNLRDFLSAATWVILIIAVLQQLEQNIVLAESAAMKHSGAECFERTNNGQS
jgi:hypothetical protein